MASDRLFLLLSLATWDSLPPWIFMLMPDISCADPLLRSCCSQHWSQTRFLIGTHSRAVCAWAWLLALPPVYCLLPFGLRLFLFFLACFLASPQGLGWALSMDSCLSKQPQSDRIWVPLSDPSRQQSPTFRTSSTDHRLATAALWFNSCPWAKKNEKQGNQKLLDAILLADFSRQNISQKENVWRKEYMISWNVAHWGLNPWSSFYRLKSHTNKLNSFLIGQLFQDLIAII